MAALFQSADDMRPLGSERLIGAAVAASMLIAPVLTAEEEPTHLQAEVPVSVSAA